MSRYESISTEIEDMKELITNVNHRFDQLFKKTDIIDEKVDTLQKDMTTVKSDIQKILEKLDRLENRK